MGFPWNRRIDFLPNLPLRFYGKISSITAATIRHYSSRRSRILQDSIAVKISKKSFNHPESQPDFSMLTWILKRSQYPVFRHHHLDHLSLGGSTSRSRPEPSWCQVVIHQRWPLTTTRRTCFSVGIWAPPISLEAPRIRDKMPKALRQGIQNSTLQITSGQLALKKLTEETVPVFKQSTL